MNCAIKKHIIGELFIPLKTNLAVHNKNEYNDITVLLNQSYSNFRTILFQNELMQMFICLKIDTAQNETFNQFDSRGDFDNIAVRLNFSSEIVDQGDIHTKYIENGKFHLSLNKVNSDSSIKKRQYLKNEGVYIIEIEKQIIVPDYYLNSKLMLKVDMIDLGNKTQVQSQFNYLPCKNRMAFINQLSINNNDKSTLSFNENDEEVVLHTLYKEIRILRPLIISLSKQICINSNHSYVQLIMENITSALNYVDKSLKESLFLINQKQSDTNVKYVTYGFPIIINYLQIEKFQTKELSSYISSFFLEKIMNVVDIQPRDHFPIIIQPGEIYNMTIDINTSNISFNGSRLKEEMIFTDNYFLNKKQNDSISSFTAFFSVFSKVASLGTTETQCSDVNKQHNEFTLETPILLYINCNSDIYKSISVGALMKWCYEYQNIISLYIHCNSSELALDKYFGWTFCVRNISSEVLDLHIEITYSMSEFKLNSLSYKRTKTECDDYFPELISEHKIYEIGKLEPNEEKEVIVNMIPLKSGIVPLQDIYIVNKITNNKCGITNKERIEIREL